MDSQREVDRAVERVRLELVSRKLMIMVLAVTAVLAGAVVMLTGAPNFLEDWFSPWSRYAIGGLSFFAGLVTCVGGLATDRTRPGWWTQVVGLTLMAAWYAAMCAAYTGVVIHQGAGFVGPGEPLSPGVTGRGYVPILYFGLTGVVLIPLVTMIRLQRPTVLGPLD